MLAHPMVVLLLMGLGGALAWETLRPGAVPATASLAFAALAVWALHRRAQGREAALTARLGRLETQVETQRAALARGDTALAAAEADLRAADERYVLAVRGSQDGLWEWDLSLDTVRLSPRWKSMLGFEPHEIADDKAGWLGRVHSDDRAAFEAALARHLASGDMRFDHAMRLLHKDGGVRSVLSRGVAIRRASGAPFRMVGLDTDVTQVRRVQDVLDAVAAGTAGAFGERFFQAMVRHFARALDVDMALITECVDQPVTKVRTLAAWSVARGNDLAFEYALENTPCAEVFDGQRLCFYRQGLRQRYPRESHESFLGLPMLASDGRMLGHIAFFDTRPRGDEMLVESVFRIFLARAAAEIERMQAVARLAAGGADGAAADGPEGAGTATLGPRTAAAPAIAPSTAGAPTIVEAATAAADADGSRRAR